MKATSTTKRKWLSYLGSLLLMLVSVSAYAQPTTMRISNCASTSNTLEFDLSLTNDGTTNTLYFQSYIYRVTIGSAALAGVTLTASDFSIAWVHASNATDIPLITGDNTKYTNSYATASRQFTFTCVNTVYGSSAAPTNFALAPNGGLLRIGRIKFTLLNGKSFVAGASSGLTFVTSSGVNMYVGTASSATSYNNTLNPTGRVLGTPCSTTFPSACTTPTFSSSVSAPTCSNVNDGSVSLNITNGQTVTYLWSNGATGSSITGLAANSGPYTCTITNTVGSCTATAGPFTIGAAAAAASIWYQDNDADNYGNTAVSQLSCTQPSGYSAQGGDCDDSRASVHPGAIEICDGLDNDCNTLIDDGLTLFTYYADADADSYGNPSSTISSCLLSPPSGYVSNPDDCNDNNAAIHAPISYFVDSDDDGYGTSATQSFCLTAPPLHFSSISGDCDDNNGAIHAPISYFVDGDGDGFGGTNTALFCLTSAPTGHSSVGGDCDDENPLVHALATYYVDADHDGFGSPVTQQLCAATAPFGYASIDSDCDDNNAAIKPGATEVCNNIDDDCDGTADDGLTFVTYYTDADHDGYGVGTGSSLCANPGTGFSTVAGDCDDNNAAAHSVETWYLDADADGHYVSSTSSCGSPGAGYTLTAGSLGDCNDNDNSVYRNATVYTDVDGDGYTVGASFVVCYGASLPSGVSLTSSGSDCDDTNPSIYQSGTFFVDNDGDTYTVGGGVVLCYGATVPSGYVSSANGNDCNDNNATVWQSATLYTDADADGWDAGSSVVCYGASIPSGYSATSNGSDCDDNNPLVHSIETWYLDADADGHYVSSTSSCGSPGAGYTLTGGSLGDCDDNNGLVYRNATVYTDVDGDGYTVGASFVVCYGASLPPAVSLTSAGEDCDDNNAAVYQLGTFFVDVDGDSYTVGSGVSLCYGSSTPSGYASSASSTDDCDDNNALVYRNATVYTDADGDGYTVGASYVVCYGASLPSGVSLTSAGTDCNDNNPAVYQSASLFIDVDGDGWDAGSSVVCYGASVPSGYSATSNGSDCDDNNALIHTAVTYYADLDNDNYGDALNSSSFCQLVAPAGYTSDNTDCNDNNSNIHPGAAEQCNNIDDDCDGFTDEGVSVTRFYADADGDGVGNAAVFIDSCAARAGYVLSSTDCDDTNGSIWQSGSLYIDVDADGWDGGSAVVCYGASIPSGYSQTSNGSDCDDNNAAAHSVETWYLDADADGHYVSSTSSCGSPGAGYTLTACCMEECDDNNALVYRTAIVYTDVDGDGYTVGASYTVCYGASLPSGVSTTSAGEDCDDNNALVYQTGTFYVDSDGDGYTVGGGVVLCYGASTPSGYATAANGNDCNDNNAAVYQSSMLYVDADGDGYTVGAASSVCYGASIPSGYSSTSNGEDCDDTNAAIYQSGTFFVDNDGDSYTVGGGVVLCYGASTPSGYATASNGNDCNDNNPAVWQSASLYIDADGDGYDAGSSVVCYGAAVPSGYSATSNGSDCDDAHANAHPGLSEVCGDGIDNNCDGFVDEGCSCTNPPTANAGAASSICAGNNVSLNGIIGGGATSGTWSTSGDGTFSPSNAVLNATYIPGTNDISNGTVTLTLTTDAVSPCVPATSSRVITIQSLPASTGAISGPAGLCSPINGVTATYSVAPVVGASTYTWTVLPGMNIISGQGTTSITVTFTTANVHNGIVGNISVQANNSNGCGSSTPSTYAVSIQISAPVQPGSISGPDKACAGDMLTYSINPVYRAASYNWSFPANVTFVGSSSGNVVTVLVGAGYTGGTISVTASNVCGTSAARTRTMTTNILPAPASISTITSSGLCGVSASFTAASVSGATGYFWSVTGGATVSGGQGTATATIDFPVGFTTGTVSVVAQNNCGNGAARSMSVIGAPATPAVITYASPICVGQPVTFSVAAVAGATSYNWVWTRGFNYVSGQGTKNLTLSGPAAATNQTISVRIQNACGLSGARVLDLLSIVSCVREGVTAEGVNLNVYPNPAHDNMSVSFNSDKDQEVTVRMMDATGRVVLTDAQNASAGYNQVEMNVKTLSSGIYMLELTIGGTAQQIRVFVD